VWDSEFTLKAAKKTRFDTNPSGAEANAAGRISGRYALTDELKYLERERSMHWPAVNADMSRKNAAFCRAS
jgi:hypothetical protein